MEIPKPTKEHEFLRRFAGDWTIESKADMGPELGEVTTHGTDSGRMLGDLWIICEGGGEMPGCGTEGKNLMVVGFDTVKNKFVGNWVGSMMTMQWVYEGELDESGNKLSLRSEGPSMEKEGEYGQYMDVYEFLSDDHRTLTSFWQKDGEWVQFMQAHYYKK